MRPTNVGCSMAITWNKHLLRSSSVTFGDAITSCSSIVWDSSLPSLAIRSMNRFLSSTQMTSSASQRLDSASFPSFSRSGLWRDVTSCLSWWTHSVLLVSTKKTNPVITVHSSVSQIYFRSIHSKTRLAYACNQRRLLNYKLVNNKRKHQQVFLHNC